MQNDQKKIIVDTNNFWQYKDNLRYLNSSKVCRKEFRILQKKIQRP